jgi:hypothetical protein
MPAKPSTNRISSTNRLVLGEVAQIAHFLVHNYQLNCTGLEDARQPNSAPEGYFLSVEAWGFARISLIAGQSRVTYVLPVFF